MARTPMVSVCIPSYNHARFLPETLGSILSQTFRDFELIVVDDGSTDNSLEILQNYARQYPEIVRVFTHPGQRNLGITVTENLAVQNARGLYWCGNDSDDVSCPDRLARQVDFLESHPDVGWVYGIAEYIDKEGTRLRDQMGQDLSAFPNLAEELVMQNTIVAPTTMVRMKCMREVGAFEPGLIYGDWELWIRLATRYPSAFLPGPVVGYRCHDYNTSVSFPQAEDPVRSRENIRNGLVVITTLRRKAETAKGQLGHPRTKALLDLRRAAFHLLLSERDSASMAVAAAFRSDPSFRCDGKHLATCLTRFERLRLAFMTIRELGFPPRWLGDKAFTSAMLRLGANRLRLLFRRAHPDA
jgi:glycosyltransferase involved in cell wall biosynthesis